MSAAGLAQVAALPLLHCCQAEEGELEHPKHVVSHLQRHWHILPLRSQGGTMLIWSHTS